MSQLRPVRTSLAALVGLLLALLAACDSLPGDGLSGAEEPAPAPLAIDRPPLQRRVGSRLPAFSGGDPRARGWVRVDDLLWIEARDEAAYRAGEIFDGTAYVPREAVLARTVPADAGLRLRTDHLTLSTNASWQQAVAVARAGEAHVTAFLRAQGDALDLRLPEGPLKIVLTATRREFERTLRGLVADAQGWGAFYDARSGNVYLSLEAAARGALPWTADLRHELTHQILDLSRPASRRGQVFPRPWFWLWEGIAVWSENLGDPPGRDTGAERLARFRRRHAWQDTTPLRTLFALGPEDFAGRHYDQTASLMRFLLAPEHPRRRAAILHLVARLLAGETLQADALERVTGERATGLSTANLERTWLATVGR